MESYKNIKKSDVNLNFKAAIKNTKTVDFAFLFNLEKDSLLLSDDVKKFLDVPSSEFSNACETISKNIHPEDKKIFDDTILKIKNQEQIDFLSEFRFLNENLNYVPVIVRGRLLSSKENEHLVAGMISLNETHLDDITGLPLESKMLEDYENFLKKHDFLSGFLLAVRVEGLERINENFGLDVGDKIFSLVAEACQTVVDKDTLVYRISGNKIALLNYSGRNAQDAQEIFAKLKRKVSDIEYQLEYTSVFTISAGVVAFVNDKSSLKDLLKKADFSLSMGKRSGKNNLYLFNSAEYSKHINKIFIREKLRESVKNGFKGFEMFYQPVVKAKNVSKVDGKIDGVKIVGAEALLRWSHPDLGLLGADQIIPILEDSGLIAPVGRWILAKSFSQCKVWNELNKKFHMSVNLSYMQFERSDIVLDVQMALEKSGVNPENIILEITESGYIEHVELQKILDEFHAMKIRVDIDDFGTGYSNLRYIQNLHANTLKLDYSFVHKAILDKEGESERKVIEYIINMAHDLGMQVCLEGIEAEDDIDVLAPLNADKYQGFLFGKPISSYQFLQDNQKFLSDE